MAKTETTRPPVFHSFKHLTRWLLNSPPGLRVLEQARSKSPKEQALNILDREPPKDLAVERKLLASILIRGKIADIDILSGDYYDDAHQEIHRVLLGLASNGQPIEVTFLHNALKEQTVNGKRVLDYIGGLPIVAQILNSEPIVAHVHHYAGVVKNHARRRRRVVGFANAIRMSYDGRSIEDIDNTAKEALV